jgi:subtilisin family serine protease
VDFFLNLVNLGPLMERTSGASQIVIGFMDGPLALNHPDLAAESVRGIAGEPGAGCTHSGSPACFHATFTAVILGARRDSPAPAICPGCSLLVRPIFKAGATQNGALPSATAGQIARAIVECVEAGARVLNLSAAYYLRGRPLGQTNLGSSVGRRGLLAPGEGVVSLGAEGEPLSLGGTGVGAPFVTGTIALLWSMFPRVSAAEVKHALTIAAYGLRRTTIVPPLLDAWASYQTMATTY